MPHKCYKQLAVTATNVIPKLSVNNTNAVNATKSSAPMPLEKTIKAIKGH